APAGRLPEPPPAGRNDAARSMFSATVSELATVGCWKVRATPRRERLCTGTPASDRPSRSTSPLVGRVCPVITSNRVVLPAPLGPTIPRISPPVTAKLTSSTARRPPKLLLTLDRKSVV